LLPKKIYKFFLRVLTNSRGFFLSMPYLCHILQFCARPPATGCPKTGGGEKDYIRRGIAAMRGGHNKKSVEEHLRDGTYRADRHGPRAIGDAEILRKMKQALYAKFQKIDQALEEKEIDAVTKENVNYYISVIRAFDSITKSPVKKEGAAVDGKAEL
jgi:hypothetical protein